MKKALKALLLPCALVLLMGADNQEGGEGPNADIGNWATD